MLLLNTGAPIHTFQIPGNSKDLISLQNIRGKYLQTVTLTFLQQHSGANGTHPDKYLAVRLTKPSLGCMAPLVFSKGKYLQDYL